MGVRPTTRCIADLGAELQDLGSPVEEIDDPIVASAQAVPAQRDAGGAERVVALTDGVWFKVKTGHRRAAVTPLRAGELPEWVPASRGGWWIGAAGRRQTSAAPDQERPTTARLHREQRRLDLLGLREAR